jgi:glucose uptake protein GlcU
MADDDQGPSPHRALIGLVAIVLLIVGVLFIVHRLKEAAQLQDCVASGRTNCAPIEASER